MTEHSMLFLLCCIALFTIQSTQGSQREKKFILQPNPIFGPKRLGVGWTDTSPLSCMSNCLYLYPVDCFSIMYNDLTKLCTPGQMLNQSQHPPSPDEGDLYAVRQCNLNAGFRYYSNGNAGACVLHRTTGTSYANADNYCRSLNSHLYTPRTLDKLQLLQSLVYSQTWVGLDDIDKEGTYSWKDNGDELDPIIKAAIFKPGEPEDTHAFEEDCVMLPGKLSLLEDDMCSKTKHYFCEDDG